MKILVIGGAGYIGCHVAREFLDKGHAVEVFDNLSSGCRENLFGEAGFTEGDILDYAALRRAMDAGFDGLVHLAAFKAAGESMLCPEKYSVNNIAGTINILNAACETGIPRIVFSSSAAVYGEPQYVPIDEQHPKEPENFYGHTKLAIEQLLGWYDKLKGIRHASLRYFNAAGYDVKGRVRGLEKNPANLLPVTMEAAAGMREKLEIFGNDYDTDDGTCIRDYIHVNDLADAHVRAFDFLTTNGQSLTVNLGSESGVSVMTMVEAARQVTGRDIPAQIAGRRPGDPAKLVASSALAKKHLGWEARYSDVVTLLDSTWKVYKDLQG
ncbi:MAG: UDP-glucose 4-epimerase GalE [Chitinivibrionales bacterium]|nr:UDP-glucose 4-epimerase GalE [Chitinivibrionales bacterium]MBD3396424.1 UDP-glucose 4-epimerase GalE [Chitinivibrionales bacterium]